MAQALWIQTTRSPDHGVENFMLKNYCCVSSIAIFFQMFFVKVFQWPRQPCDHAQELVVGVVESRVGVRVPRRGSRARYSVE
ncbi:hypothetical protein TNCV_2195391 [Trichonephila clavipes]|uniref:Uncharacterized protein n=1 Tax=Trichonephila clavipes TaxID=2585209 RepID=A0A8X6VK76_TRICX|nr:hypothetical protein TNCV_2195391 [Trichonephila clavipes]